MVKKFLMIMSFVLFAFSSNIDAQSLQFSYPSVIIQCFDQDSARHVSEVAQKRQPFVVDLGSCAQVQGFGTPIKSEHRDKLVLVSPIMKDWEGDEFAIFTIYLMDIKYWLIVYNPKNIVNRQKIKYFNDV